MKLSAVGFVIYLDSGLIRFVCSLVDLGVNDLIIKGNQVKKSIFGFVGQETKNEQSCYQNEVKKLQLLFIG